MTACGSDATEPSSAQPAPSVIAHLNARHEASAGGRPFDSLTDLLENVTYRMPQRPTGPMSDAVVIGRVADVVPGLGFYVEGEDGPTGIETDYDDPRSMWRTVHVTLDVDTVLSGSAPRGRVVVGFAFGASMPFDRVEHDFRSYGSLLLFLERDQPVFDYDPSIYGTLMDGALLGFVDDDGRIELPVLDETDAAGLLQEAPTVGELRAAATRPHRTVHVDASGGIVE